MRARVERAKDDIKERKNFNKQFLRADTARLCELASASHYLDLKSLIDLTCRALAKHIQGKNPEEIRETFNLPDDLTEEEKVAPIEFGMEVSTHCQILQRRRESGSAVEA